MEEMISLQKAVEWMNEHVYAGFDSMCLGFDRKNECIDKFIEDMRDPNYGKKYDEDW